MLTRAPQVFAINLKLPVSNQKELIDNAKKNPGKVIKGAKITID